MESISECKPFNARVDVNYKEGTVKFGYPNPEDSFRRRFLLFLSHLLGYYFLLAGFTVLIIGFLTNITNNEVVVWNIHPHFIALFLMGLFFLPPIILSGIMAYKYSWFSRTWPKFNVWVHKLRHGKVYFINVSSWPTNQTEPIIEVPSFDNILLKYEATGDYSKQLERVEVREHPFRFRNKKEGAINEFWWKAKFYFKEIPKEGELRIEFI